MDSPWMTRTEAAAYSRLSKRTIDALRSNGKLIDRTVGRRVLIHRDELDNCLLAGGLATLADQQEPPVAA